MGYELIKEDGAKKVVRFTMPASDLKRLFRKVKRDISKEISIPGFRPGHVPDAILEKRYGNLIIAEVAEMAHKELSEGLFDQYDWVLSDEDPSFENLLPVEGEDYEYTVTYTTFQTPEPVDYREIKLTLPLVDLEKMTEDTMERLRKQFVDFTETDSPAGENDLVVLTYPSPDKGDDKPRELTAVIGQNDMGPGFDELVTGVKPGDTFTMQMKITKDGAEEMAGPAHTFTVKEVKAHSFPDLDDEFASKAGGFETLDEFRAKVREDLQTRHDAEMKSYKERLAIDSLLDSNEFEVPGFMVDNLKRDFLERLDDEERDEATVKAAEEMAARKVREFLLLREIAIKESLEISEEEIAEAVEQGDTASAYLDRSRNEKALELVLDSAIIEEKEPEEPQEESGDINTVPWRWVSVEPAGEQTETEGEE